MKKTLLIKGIAAILILLLSLSAVSCKRGNKNDDIDDGGTTEDGGTTNDKTDNNTTNGEKPGGDNNGNGGANEIFQELPQRPVQDPLQRPANMIFRYDNYFQGRWIFCLGAMHSPKRTEALLSR